MKLLTDFLFESSTIWAIYLPIALAFLGLRFSEITWARPTLVAFAVSTILTLFLSRFNEAGGLTIYALFVPLAMGLGLLRASSVSQVYTLTFAQVLITDITLCFWYQGHESNWFSLIGGNGLTDALFLQPLFAAFAYSLANALFSEDLAREVRSYGFESLFEKISQSVQGRG